MKKIASNKAITLIALVITIIILLILAGITIATLTGENGILTKSKNASEETNKQTATEIINLKITTAQINTYAKEQRMPTLQEVANTFCKDNEIEYVVLESKVSSLNEIDIQGHNSFFTKLNEYPYEFEINSSLQLASINGVKLSKIPEDDEDKIISMTKSELQELINISINNSLKNYSTTKEINEEYATREELNTIKENKSTVPTLDWNSKIDITNQLNAIGKTYTAPKNGIIRVFADQNNSSDCCLDLSTNETYGSYKKYYANNTTSWLTFTDEFQINASSTLTVLSDSILNGFRSFYLEFVPYK